jgi:invasion protein IalB
MFKSLVRFLSLAIACAIMMPLASAPADAAKAKKSAAGSNKALGAFKDWNAYMLDDPTKKVCFVVSEPKSKKLSKGATRGDPFFLVTRWAPGQTPQPSTIVGYPQAPGTKAKVTIGTAKFEMFVDTDGAWMESEDGDKKLLEAMRKGSTMIIESVSAKGTKSTDRYSLAGLSAALDKAGETCK